MVKQFKSKGSLETGAGIYAPTSAYKLKKILDKQFASAEANNIAVFGEGIYRTIIAHEYRMQIVPELLKEYIKTSPVAAKDAELLLCISTDCKHDDNGLPIMDTAKHTLFFNYKHNTVDISPDDIELHSKIYDGINEDMTIDQTQERLNTNIRNIILQSENTHILFYYISDSMMKVERSAIK